MDRRSTIRAGLLVSVAALSVNSLALAQTTPPSTLQSQINALPWTNHQGQLTGADIMSLFNTIVAIFTTWVPTAFVGAAIAPTSTAQLNTAIASAISSGSGISLVPGAYSVGGTTGNIAPNNVPAAVIVNAPGNFTFDGQGAVISLTGADVSSYATIMQFQNAIAGTTATLKNLTLKYAVPPFAQAVLSSMTACVANANGSAVFAINAGFAPAWASVQRINQYNPNPDTKTGTVGLFVTNNYDDDAGALTVSNSSPSTFTLAFNGATQCTKLATMTNGLSYLLDNIQFGYDAIVFYKMARVVLDNVTVMDSAGHAVTFLGATDIMLKNGTGVIPAPGMYRSTNGGPIADIASSGVFVADPTTRTSFGGDDGLFIAPYTTAITSVTSRTSILATGSPFMFVVDTLQFIDPSGVMQGTAIVSALTPTAGNTTITLAGTGAPAGIPIGSGGSAWVIADKSQAPSLCSIGGTYGQSPTRGIWADCGKTIFNQPAIQDTGASAIYVAYNDGNIGIVPDKVIFNQPTSSNSNYANDAMDAAFEVAGWGWNSAGAGSRNGAATAGQFPSIVFNQGDCLNSGEGCLYVSAAKQVSASFGTFQSWYQNAAVPGNTQGCGTNLYQNAVAWCNDQNVVRSPGYFLGSGSEEGFSNSTIGAPQFPSASLIGLTGTGFGAPTSTIAGLSAHPCNSGTANTWVWIKDTVASGAATFHGAVTGGGSTTVNSLATCNGSNWQYD